MFPQTPRTQYHFKFKRFLWTISLACWKTFFLKNAFQLKRKSKRLSFYLVTLDRNWGLSHYSPPWNYSPPLWYNYHDWGGGIGYLTTKLGGYNGKDPKIVAVLESLKHRGEVKVKVWFAEKNFLNKQKKFGYDRIRFFQS